ncbi:MAG TPA: hypothetical protein VGI81_17190 [Tepidisphaeraceae bacterium]|jgi:hypothetical protein
MGYDNVSGSQSGRAAGFVETLECRQLFSSAYSVTDLGPVVSPGGNVVTNLNSAYANPMGLNNSGQVVAKQPGPKLNSPVLFANGQVTPLASLSRWMRNAEPHAINDSGVIVGGFLGARTETEWAGGYGFFGATYPITVRLTDAFVYDGRRFRDIGPGYATGINSSGEVVGVGDHGGAFLYANGHRRALLPPHIRPRDIAGVAINDAGDVVVSGYDNGYRAYLYAHGSRTAVPLGPTPFDAVAINDAGQVAGTAADPLSASAAMLVTPTGTASLGPGDFMLSSMNASGEVVGREYVPGTNYNYLFVAVASQNGTLVDLNTLVPPSETGWTLRYAQAVNDVGQIAVIATNGVDVPHYLLLTPT